jgi:hypothetical protein
MTPPSDRRPKAGATTYLRVHATSATEYLFCLEKKHIYNNQGSIHEFKSLESLFSVRCRSFFASGIDSKSAYFAGKAVQTFAVERNRHEASKM